MKTYHPICQHEVERPDDEEPYGYGVDYSDISEGWQEEDGAHQKLEASEQKIDGVEESPGHAVLVYLFGRLFHVYSYKNNG